MYFVLRAKIIVTHVTGVVVCIVVGMMIYNNRQENSRKRFY